MTVENYHGTIAYSNSFFFEGPPVVITQRGAAEVNITLWCVQIFIKNTSTQYSTRAQNACFA
jgi:hypothetical protein